MWDVVAQLPHYLLSFLFVLTVVVFFHELGHFLVARWAGVKVEVFSVGFGPELFGFTDRRGTRWKVSALPLGGYVKMFGEGEAGRDEKGEPQPLTPEQRKVSFFHKPLARRAAIVAAGPIANYVLAVIIFAVLFATYGQQFSSNEVGLVVEDSAAAEAGIEPGDRIVEMNGNRITRFEQIVASIELGLDEPLHLVIERDGRRIPLDARPHVIEITDNFGNTQRVGRLGIQSTGAGELVRYDPIHAVSAAVTHSYELTTMILKAIGQIISGTRSSEELGGVIRIAKMSGDVATNGLVALLGFTALMSVNLGLLNLFPVPMLDGGHLAFYAIEGLRGRRLSQRAEEWGLRIGLAMVLTLFIFATWNDLVTLPW
ncbi:MAG: RIP metalloprotease RseP [Dongiaceae bacterium]